MAKSEVIHDCALIIARCGSTLVILMAAQRPEDLLFRRPNKQRGSHGIHGTGRNHTELWLASLVHHRYEPARPLFWGPQFVSREMHPRGLLKKNEPEGAATALSIRMESSV